jgi:hypothetical protein
MGFTVVAVVTGLVLGLARGGRLAHVARHRLRWPAALVAGAGLQLAGEAGLVGEGLGRLLVALSYAALLAFAVANLALVGMGVVLVGLVLNTLVIGLNGGMPVRAEAIVATGLVEPEEVAGLELGAKRHLEGPDDRLSFLGDVIPVPPLGEVLSFGDLVLATGLTALVFRLVRPARRPRPEVGDPPRRRQAVVALRPSIGGDARHLRAQPPTVTRSPQRGGSTDYTSGGT